MSENKTPSCPPLAGPLKQPEENSLIKVLKKMLWPTAFRKHAVSRRGWSEVSLWPRLQGWEAKLTPRPSPPGLADPPEAGPCRLPGPASRSFWGGSEARWPEKVTESSLAAWAQCQAPAQPLHPEEAATFLRVKAVTILLSPFPGCFQPKAHHGEAAHGPCEGCWVFL